MVRDKVTYHEVVVHHLCQGGEEGAELRSGPEDYNNITFISN